jgi:hypothetical protein
MHEGSAVPSGPPVGPALPEDAGRWSRTVARARRHVHWARHEGIGRLVEEDQLDPRERWRAAAGSARWVRRHGVEPGQARAAFVVGVQRSGTNMVVRGVESDPSVKVYNENSRRAFERFQLRDPEAVRSLVTADRHRLVLFKALCDSHRTADLLEEAGRYTPARAVWVYRGVDDRVRSAVSKFGDVNRRVMAEIAAGEGGGRWQAQRLSPESLELVRSVGPSSLSAESGAALFWLVRNRLYFEQGLHDRDDVHLVGYDQVVADPEGVGRALFSFLDLPFSAGTVGHVDARSARARPPLDLDPRVREACDRLEHQLAVAAAAKHAHVVSG